jgi:hypothetical protein
VGSACHVILTASFRRREPSANSATQGSVLVLLSQRPYALHVPVQFGLVTSFILQVTHWSTPLPVRFHRILVAATEGMPNAVDR